jgi:hypothetical protein
MSTEEEHENMELEDMIVETHGDVSLLRFTLHFAKLAR